MKSSERDIARLFLAQLHERIGPTQALERELEQARAASPSASARGQGVGRQRETAKLKELDRRAELVLEQFEAQAREVIDGHHFGADQRKAAERRASAASRRPSANCASRWRSHRASTLDEARQGDLRNRRPRVWKARACG